MTYKKVLVIGGTKQMGIHLVEGLLQKNYDVTIANRGKNKDSFGNSVKRIVMDRYNEESVANAFENNNSFDAVIDTVAFNGSCVDMLFRYIKTKKYIQFSAISVYSMLTLNQKETDFNPLEFDAQQFNPKFEYLSTGDKKYQLGKKAAEKAALTNCANAVIIRIPSVAGEDALNPMIKQYAEYISMGKEICLDRTKFERKFALTETSEPGRFAVFALENDLSGIYNISSNGYVTNEMIVSYMEKKLGKKANIVWGDVNNCFHTDFPEHTFDTTKAKGIGFKFRDIDEWLPRVLDYFSALYIHNVIKAPTCPVPNKKNASMLTSMGEVVYRFLQAVQYGGTVFEYLDDIGVNEFDLYVEEEAISFLPVLFNLTRHMPNHIYGNVNDTIRVKTILSGKSTALVEPLNMTRKNETQRVLISFCHWNYSLYKKFESLNYKHIPLITMADYALYKNVVLKKCKSFLEARGIQCLFTRFPKANLIKNPSPLEKYLSANGIYGITPESAKSGLDLSEVYEDTAASTELIHGAYQYEDITSEYLNISNGFRVTTDLPPKAKKRIWIFGSSVVLGYFADDEHTIASGLQRELNEYFGEKNEYSVVNASNYSAHDVGAVYPFVERLPIVQDDICIFNMEFPSVLLEKYDEIIDLNRKFDRPHEFGEVFADINHMVGRGYCAQGKVLFDLLKDFDYFGKKLDVNPQITQMQVNNNNGLSSEENEQLHEYLKMISVHKKEIGSIVMNCNPFTLGHRYLIEESAKKVDQLFIFVVEEDKSFFSFKDRLKLVKKGTQDLKNVTVIPSGQFIISQRTFEAYSNKSKLQNQKIDASLDVEIFAKNIAPALGITKRFAGEEPLDNVTQQYNDTMQRMLPKYGIQFEVIPRKESGGQVISASRVRALLEKKDFDTIKQIVPATTYEYLYNKYKDSKQVLVLGGTRFMGIRLVERLIEKNHFITIATRGIHEDSFEKNVTRIKLDRKNEQSIIEALEGREFDYIFDNIAYTGNDVKRLLPYVKCKNYIQVSSIAVYGKGHLCLKEEEQNTYKINYISSDEIQNYGMAKRFAECVALQEFPNIATSIVRVPFVVDSENLGTEELNQRLFFYVEHIMERKAMKIDNFDFSCSFVRTKEEADFLIYLAENNLTGVYNFSSRGSITIKEIIEYIEKKSGITAIISENGDVHPFRADYFGQVGCSYNLSKTIDTGYPVSDLKDWIFALLDSYIETFQ